MKKKKEKKSNCQLKAIGLDLLTSYENHSNMK